MHATIRDLTAGALLCLALLHNAAAAALELYVSPGGDDRWSGALREPNAGRTDGPLASLPAARDALRQRRAAGALTGPATVWVQAGTYALNATLEFDERDAGAAATPVTYQAWPGAEVRLSGGRDLPASAVQPVADPAVLARLISPEARTAVRQVDLRALGITDYGALRARGFRRPYVAAPLEVFCDGEPLWLARWPNDRTVPIGKVIDPGAVPRDGDTSDRGGVFEYGDERHARWAEAKDLWLSGLWHYGYADDTIPVATIDPAKRTVSMAQATMYGIATGAPWRAYYALNLLEEIDQPGEYYVDRAHGILYLYPPSTFAAGRSRLQVSLLGTPMLALEGVSHLSFAGLIFECSRGLGAYIERGTGNRFVGCTFRNLGQLAVCVGKGTQPLPVYAHAGTATPASRRLGSWHEHLYDNPAFDREAGTGHRIESCDIYNTGAGGVSLGGGDRRTLTPGGNVVRNCHIHHFNRLDRSYKAAVNVDGVANRIEHCLIHDAPNNAIYLHGNDHLIEFNEIHDCCQVADDMGAFYMGRDPSEAGNLIRYNFWHENGSALSGAHCDIYFDDGASGTRVVGNVFRSSHGWASVFVHAGAWNEITGNVFVDCDRAVRTSMWDGKRWDAWLRSAMIKARLSDHVDIAAAPYRERYPVLADLYREGQPRDSTLVAGNVLFRCQEVAAGLATTRDNLLTDTDPGFADLAAADFTLAPDAPTRRAAPGFAPIPFARIGLYVDPWRPVLPMAAPAILARDNFFGSTAVRLAPPRRAAALVYTLDGSAPGPHSPRYTEPFRLEQTTTIKACALADAAGTAIGPVATLTATRIEPVLPEQAKVNFGPDGVALDADWLADSGHSFALRDRGLAYGWTPPNPGAVRRRGKHPDPVLDTLIHFAGDSVWEMAVRNGVYELTVSVGDAEFACADQTLLAEGVEVARGLNLAAGEFKRLTARVTVRDGGLTLTAPSVPHGPRLTRLTSLELRRLE